MIAVSQLDSGNERRSVASHMLYAALPSGLCIMYDAVSRSGSGPSAAPVDRMAMSNFQVCHPRSDLPKSCCGAWTPRRRPEVRRVCFGEAPGSRGQLPGRQGVLLEGAEGSSDGLPLCLSQKSAPWTNQSWPGKVCLPINSSPYLDTSDCATATPRWLYGRHPLPTSQCTYINVYP